MSGSPTDRRRGSRAGPDSTRWSAQAVLRPGVPVLIVNIGPFGALVECQARLRPGRAAELQLLHATTDERQVVRGRIERCHVVGLAPLSFRGAIAFEAAVAELGAG